MAKSMARKNVKTAQRTKSTPPAKPSVTPSRSRSPLLDESSITSLRKQLARIPLTSSSSPTYADTLLDPLLRPVRLLEELDDLAHAVLNREADALSQFRSRLANLAQGLPELRGSVKGLSGLVGLTPNPIGTHAPCGLLSPGKLLPIYSAISAAIRFGSPDFDAAMDLVSGLSQLHSSFEKLYGAMEHDGPEGLAKEAKWLANAGGLRSSFGTFSDGSASYTPLPDGGAIRPEIFPFPILRPPAPVRPSDLTPCERVRLTCQAMLEEAMRPQTPPPPAYDTVVNSDGITFIDGQGKCGGDTITLHGTFPPQQPAHIDVVLHTDQGCVPAQVQSWSQDRIVVILLDTVRPGPVGFLNKTALQIYNIWIDAMNARNRDLAKASRCLGIAPLKVPALRHLVNPCPAETLINFLVAGRPVIKSFSLNYQADSSAAPGEEIVLRWAVTNYDQITISRLSATGPTFGGNTSISDPPGTSWNFGPASHTTVATYRYELRATNSCGPTTAQVTVRAISQAPTLSIYAVEVTQGVQTMFHGPGTTYPDSAQDNSVPLVGSKDTIVRVYVSSTRHGWPTNEARITGVLYYEGGPVAPIRAQIIARPAAEIDRWNADHTLNFRLPGAWCTGTQSVWIYVEWIEEPDRDVRKIASHGVTWHYRRALPIRYVRVRADNHSAPSNADALHTVVRAFDLLPTPPTNIAPASYASHGSDHDGESDYSQWRLLHSLTDKHSCGTFEWFSEDCDRPDEHLFWIGVCGDHIRGIAPNCKFSCGVDPFSDGKTGLVPVYPVGDTTASSERVTCAHEIGHLLGLGHVRGHGDVSCYCVCCDDLPHDAVIFDPVFDPYRQTIVQETDGKVVDMMTYFASKWTSIYNWSRMFQAIGG